MADPHTTARCFWAEGAPSGLSDAAEGWGIVELATMFQKAHRRFKNHDDGKGCCRVCGAAIDFEGWLDEQDATESERG